jgi:hypothetical protein
VLDHLDDLDADFRVFYRIDDIEQLSGPRFLALALRVFAYQGVMASRAAEQQDGDIGGHSGSRAEVRQVEGSRQAITADPVLAGLVSWGEG